MSFSENLQNLRKINQLSQEQLAEELDVSRQAVSKWESGNGYPEMDKLISICDIFDCSMDQLLRGVITFDAIGEKQKYETMQDRFSKCIAFGVGIILFGVTVLLYCIELSQMFQQDTRYGIMGLVILLTCVLVAVAVFIKVGSEEEQFKRKYPTLSNFYFKEEIEIFEKKFMKAIIAGVSLILIGVILLIFLYGMKYASDNSILPVVILMVFVTIAVVLFVYYGIQKDKYDIDKYNKINSKILTKSEKIVGKSGGVIMLIATIIFLITGLIYKMWEINWIVYPIGGILCGIVAIIFDQD